MSTMSPPPALQRANTKAMKRLLPILALLLFVNYLDRVNVGFAAPTMNPAIDLTATTYGIGVAVFFIGYVLLEIPSNYVMFRIGARKWLSRIAVSWGIVAALHAFVVDFPTFALARVLLGIAEAGLLPGILLYISLWFSGPQRILVLGIYYVALPLSTALGGPLSNWLIHIGDTIFGVEGWRFMFAFEGLLAVALGVVVFFVLPSLPRDARWLTLEEKEAMAAASEAAEAGHHQKGFFAALRSAVTLRLAGIFFLMTFPMFAISFFLPLVTSAIAEAGPGAVSLVTFIPFSLGAIGSFVWSRFSHRRGLRPWHYGGPIVLAGVAVLVCALSGSNSFPVLLAGVTVAAVGIYSAAPIFWSFATGSLSGSSSAAGLALINTVGSIGGFVAGYFTGWLRDATGDYRLPLAVMALSLVLSGVIALATLGRHILSVAPVTVNEDRATQA